MAKPKRTYTSTPGTSFVTVATHQRRPLFHISRVAELFIETLLHCRTHGLLKLHAWVVMPTQVHLLLTPQSGSVESAIFTLQDGFAERLGLLQPVWESGFNGHPIRSLRDLEKLRTHLHQLPVLAKLTPTPELYPYSSAHRTA